MADNIMAVAGTAFAAIDDTMDASAFVQNVRSNFRRRQATGTGGRAGRRLGPVWKCHLFLLGKHNHDFLPTGQEMTYLTRNGIGVPVHEQPSPSERCRRQSAINTKWSLLELEDYVIGCFPRSNLGRISFKYARSSKNRILQVLTPDSVVHLRKLTKSSVLYILPSRDLLDPMRDHIIAAAENPGQNNTDEASGTGSQPAAPPSSQTLDPDRDYTRTAPANQSQNNTDQASGTGSQPAAPAISQTFDPVRDYTRTAPANQSQNNTDQASGTGSQPAAPACSQTLDPDRDYTRTAPANQSQNNTDQASGTGSQPAAPSSSQTLDPVRDYTRTAPANQSQNNTDQASGTGSQPAAPSSSQTFDPVFPDVVFQTPDIVASDSDSESLNSLVEDDDILSMVSSIENGTNTRQEMDSEIKDAFNSLNLSLQDSTVVTVRRGDIEEALSKYREPAILTQSLTVDFMDEQGADFGGLTKDFFTSTWIKVLELYFRGEAAVVPFLPLHLQRQKKKDFIAIGRLIAHSMAILKTLPPRLSCSLLLEIAFDGDQVSDEVLLHDFLLFLTPSEKDVIMKGLKNFSCLSTNENKIIEILFSMFGYLELPARHKFHEQVMAIARNELVDKPGPFVELIKKGIPQYHFEHFWSVMTVDSIKRLYQLQRPSPTAVREVIVTEHDPLTPQQEIALYFLKKFVGELDQEECENFLRFTTASLVMPKKILVTFTGLIGIQRRPVAHTCSNQIDLPHTYETYQEFRREFRNVLENPDCYIVDMI